MADFDFDELDKAVADVLATDEPTSPVVPDIPLSEPETPAVAAPRQEPLEVAPRPAPSPAPGVAPSEVSQPGAPAARRSAGRFMDVVHPSSDMRPARTLGFIPPTPTPSTPPALKTDAAPEEDLNGLDLLEDWAKPLDSPFLPDAKVEKRPLGGFPVPTHADKDDELLLEAPDEPRIEAVTMPDPIDFAAHTATLPSLSEDTGAEIQPVDRATEEAAEAEAAADEAAEIEMTAEAIEQVDAPASNFPETAPSLDEVALETNEETPEEKEISPEPFTAAPQPEAAEGAPVGPVSITQQYTEKPSTPEVSGAIYDTEAYHAPVAAAPKNKSGIWVVLWIILLVILGAGAGVAFYLYVLPMLG